MIRWAVQFLPLVLVVNEVPLLLWILGFFLSLLALWDRAKQLFVASLWIRLLSPLFVLAGVSFSLSSFYGVEWAIAMLSLLIPLKALEQRTHLDSVKLECMKFILVACFLIVNIDWMGQILGLLTIAVIIYNITQIERQTAPLRISFGTALRVLAAVGLSFPIIFLLFLFFPRVRLNVPALYNRTSQVLGFSEEIRPGSLKDVLLSDELQFYIDIKNQRIQEVYLWGSVLDQTEDGFRWIKSDISPSNDVSNDRTARLKPLTDKPFQFRSYYPELKSDTVFAPTGLSTLTPSDRSVVLKPSTQASPMRQSGPFQNIAFDGTFVPQEIQVKWPTLETEPIRLRRAAPGAMEIAEDLKKLSSTAEKVRALQDHFQRENFRYSLSFNPSESLDEFLFQTREGICEHFAGATASLLRLSGVTAHVAVGYHGEPLPRSPGEIIIRSKDAHAWVVYHDVESDTWIELDPTKWISDSDEQVRLSKASQAQGLIDWMNERKLALEVFWTKFVINFDLESQKELLLSQTGLVLSIFTFGIGLILIVIFYRKSHSRRKLPLLYRSAVYWIRLFEGTHSRAWSARAQDLYRSSHFLGQNLKTLNLLVLYVLAHLLNSTARLNVRKREHAQKP